MNTFGPGDQSFIQGTDVGSLMLTTTVRNFVITRLGNKYRCLCLTG